MGRDHRLLPAIKQVSLGFVEGLNNRILQRRTYGLRNEEHLRFKILNRMLNRSRQIQKWLKSPTRLHVKRNT